MTRDGTARAAGWLYLATLPTAGFGYGYVAFMPREDPAALLAALDAGRSVLGSYDGSARAGSLYDDAQGRVEVATTPANAARNATAG